MTLSHPETKNLTERIIGIAVEIHRLVGPGLLESTYEECMCLDFGDARIPYLFQPQVPLVYKGRRLKANYRPDIIVESQVIVEIKAVEKVLAVHKAQLLTYMRHADIKVGLLFNFNTTRLVDGITRISL